jgi:hypothetical protein
MCSVSEYFGKILIEAWVFTGDLAQHPQVRARWKCVIMDKEFDVFVLMVSWETRISYIFSITPNKS